MSTIATVLYYFVRLLMNIGWYSYIVMVIELSGLKLISYYVNEFIPLIYADLKT